MGDIQAHDLIGLIPPQYAEMIGGLVALVIAVRTALRALAWLAHWADVALDGKVDWAWPDKLTAAINWLDSKVDLAVVSALLPKPKAKDGAK